MKEETNKKEGIFHKLSTKRKIAAIVIAAILLVCIIVLAVATSQNRSHKNDKQPAPAVKTEAPEASKRPILLPPQNNVTTGPALTATPQATETSTGDVTATAAPAASQAAPTPTPEIDVSSIVSEENVRTGIDALMLKEETEKNQETFDRYVSEKKFEEAKKLLDQFFLDNSYANNSLATYNNYVAYYEAQGLYQESARFQLDYMESKDGLSNVRSESAHYTTLTATLEKVPGFTDPRLSTIQASVAKWKELSDLYLAGQDREVIAKCKDYIKNGQDDVTAYLYLAQSQYSIGEYLEAAKTYYCYLGKDVSTMNQLEQSYYSIFSNMLNSLYYKDNITSEEVEFLESEFDYKNYLK